MTATMIVLDVAGVAMLGVVLWRLLVDRTREQRVQSMVGDLRTLIAEAEREARVVDERLAAHVERLRGLLRGAPPRAERGDDERRARARAEAVPTEGPRTEAPADDHQTRARRVRELAARATPIEEIARRVDLPLAEIRLLVGLQQGRRSAPAPGKKSAARTAA